MIAGVSTIRCPSYIRCSAFASACAVYCQSALAAAEEPCFERIDTGVDMTGWRQSTTNPHGPGDGWSVEDGAFVGRQTAGEQGGILMTEQSYTDVEVVFQVRIDWGCDSGLFFRTTDGNRAYQVTIDHVGDSSVGTIWGESFSQQLRAIPYWLTDNGNAAVLAPNRTEEPIFDLGLWPELWDPTAFNEMRARIEGNPPHIQVWISGTRVMDFTDAMLRSEVDGSGPLAIQVHGGSRWTTNGTVAFKNIRVRDLTEPCNDPGTGGSGGAGGGAGGGVGGDAGASAGGGAGGGADGGTAGGAGAGIGGAGGDGGATAAGGAGAGAGGAAGSGGEALSGAAAGTSAGGVAGDAMPQGGGMPTSGTTGTTAPNRAADDGSGCACRVASPDERGATRAFWLLAGIAVVARRRRRLGSAMPRG
jgi:MYXO-CTERM domain-containing protein